MRKVNVTKADVLLISCLIVASLAGIALQQLAPSVGGQFVHIQAEGKLIHSITLRNGYYQEIELDNKGQRNVVELRDNKVRMKYANCSDGDCVMTGWIQQPPRQIVCLPHQVVITLISTDSTDLDDIVR